MKQRIFIISFLMVLNNTPLNAQISPPGMGKSKLASWFAFGIRQELDTFKNRGWQSMTHIGLGRKSNPDSYNLVQKPAIGVINQEFFHQFASHWQYSLALSYRRTNEYESFAPFLQKNPRILQEFRYYSRFSYTYKNKKLDFVATLHPEIRKFFTPNFKNPSESFQFRSRLKLQVKVNLDKEKIHRIITSSEVLFSTSKETHQKKWTPFDYQKTRLMFYYSYSPPKLPLVFNFGYNNDLVGKSPALSVHSLAFDIIWENPFQLKKRKKEETIESFE